MKNEPHHQKKIKNTMKTKLAVSNEISAMLKKKKKERQTLPLIPSTEKGNERPELPSYRLLLGDATVLPIKICVYKQMFTLVDILRLRNAV